MTEQPTTPAAAPTATPEDIAAAQAVLASAGIPAPAPVPAAAPTAADIAAAHAVIAASQPAPEPVAPLTVHDLLRILGDRVFEGDQRTMFADAVTASDPTS